MHATPLAGPVFGVVKLSNADASVYIEADCKLKAIFSSSFIILRVTLIFPFDFLTDLSHSCSTHITRSGPCLPYTTEEKWHERSKPLDNPPAARRPESNVSTASQVIRGID